MIHVDKEYSGQETQDSYKKEQWFFELLLILSSLQPPWMLQPIPVGTMQLLPLYNQAIGVSMDPTAVWLVGYAQGPVDPYTAAATGTTEKE